MIDEKRFKELADKKKHTPDERKELDDMLEEKCKKMREDLKGKKTHTAFA